MNLTCPSCGATFFIEAAHLGPAGRRVRAGDSRHTWRQKPVPEDQAPAPASASEPAADPGAEQAAAKAAAKPFAPSEATTASAAPEPAEASTPEPPAKAAPAAAGLGFGAGAGAWPSATASWCQVWRHSPQRTRRPAGPSCADSTRNVAPQDGQVRFMSGLLSCLLISSRHLI